MKAVISHDNTLDTVLPICTSQDLYIHTTTMNMDKKIVVCVCELVNL